MSYRSVRRAEAADLEEYHDRHPPKPAVPPHTEAFATLFGCRPFSSSISTFDAWEFPPEQLFDDHRVLPSG